MGSGDIASICAGMIHFGKLMMFYNSAGADGDPRSVSVQALDSVQPPIDSKGNFSVNTFRRIVHNEIY